MNRRKFVIRASRLLVATPSVIDPSEAAFNKFPAKAPSHSFLQRLATSRKTQSHRQGMASSDELLGCIGNAYDAKPVCRNSDRK